MDAGDIALQDYENDDPFDINYIPPHSLRIQVYDWNDYRTDIPMRKGDISTFQLAGIEQQRLRDQLKLYQENRLHKVIPKGLVWKIYDRLVFLNRHYSSGQENQPVTITDGRGLKSTRWTDFVRKYAKENKIPYGCALSKASEEYKKHKGIVKNIKTSVSRKEEYAKRYLGSTVGEGFGDFFKKTLPSGLIHQGIPILGTVAGTALGSIAGPVSSVIGSQIGAQAGEALADDIGRKTGYGIRNRVLRKGSSIVRR
jgi:hypothetical protein